MWGYGGGGEVEVNILPHPNRKRINTFSLMCRGVGMGKQVGSMDEEPQVRGCYNITFICTPTNQETVSVLEKNTSKQNI